jgi:hypothetical protein
VGVKLSELKEGDKVSLKTAQSVSGKEPYNVITMKKVE